MQEINMKPGAFIVDVDETKLVFRSGELEVVHG